MSVFDKSSLDQNTAKILKTQAARFRFSFIIQSREAIGIVKYSVYDSKNYQYINNMPIKILLVVYTYYILVRFTSENSEVF